MRRDISRLADTTFDLLIVGAGIYGACAAWDAALRGLTVAVVDQGDFGAGTSANSLRIVHGGLRYLARGRFSRMLESIGSAPPSSGSLRGWWSRFGCWSPPTAPLARGRIAHAAALALNDLVSWNRNRHLDPDHKIPRGRVVSRDECLRLFPWFEPKGLSGGAIWHDAQLRHPERLTLSFLRAAASNGALPANYLRVEGLLTQGGAVRGARAIDSLTGTELEIGLARCWLRPAPGLRTWSPLELGLPRSNHRLTHWA